MEPMWIALALGTLAFAIVVVVALPSRLLRLAWRNRIRLDGTVSPVRARREVKKLLDLVGGLLVVPLLVMGVFGGAVALVHYYIIPIPIATDILSAFNTDRIAWEKAIEEGARGDLGEQYEWWSNQRGFSEQTARFWQEFLWEHWLALAICAVLFGLFSYWFATQYYVYVLRRYQTGLLRRRKRYQDADMASLLKGKLSP